MANMFNHQGLIFGVLRIYNVICIIYTIHVYIYYIYIYIPPEIFSKKYTLQTRSKPTGEQPCRSVISTKPFCNFIDITSRHGCPPPPPRKFTTQSQNTILQESTSGGLLLYMKRFSKDYKYKKLFFIVVKINLLKNNKK